MIDEPMLHPRNGPLGVWDQIVGPGADPVETGLVVAAMIAGPGLAVAWALAIGVDWAWWQWLVVSALASDLVGGLASNALAPAKRWRHRPERGSRAQFTACAVQVHPLVLALATPDALTLRTALIVYGLLLAGAGLTIIAPARLKGAVALLYSAAGIAACAIWLPLGSPEGWLPAILYLKVIAGYLVPLPEAPVPEGPWS